MAKEWETIDCLKKLERKILKKFPWLILIILLFMVIWACFKAVYAFSGKFPSEIIKEISSPDVNSDKYYKSNFDKDDIKKWNGHEEFFIDKKEKIFKPKITQNFLGGRDMFFPELCSPNFYASLTVVPQDERMINVALNYGYLFRVIIGNGDYNQIQLQYNSKYPNKNLRKDDWKEISEVNQKKWIKRNGRLEARKQIAINLRSRVEHGTNKIFIELIINGILMGESDRRDFDFSYEINADENSLGYNEFIGIGLLDPFEEGLQTQLNEFELHKL